MLPRAAQYKNLIIAIYNTKKIPALYVPIRHFFTHAWLPKDKFDEIIEKDGWIFARKQNGYLALRSQNPYFWNTDTPPPERRFVFGHFPEDMNREIIAPGAQNIWLCQLGRKNEDGSFERFVESICSAGLKFNGLNVEFQSPGNGRVRFGWQGPLQVEAAEISLRGYPRYDNPYVQAEFDTTEIQISAGGYRLFLNWNSGERLSFCNCSGS
jgi:hypothetical protein